MDCQLCPSGPNTKPSEATVVCPHCGEHLCQECWDESGGAEGCQVYQVMRDSVDALSPKGE